MGAVLIVRDERLGRGVDPELVAAATAEVLRTALFAADVVLVPATLDVLPLAAVIARGLVRAESLSVDASTSAILPRPGRYVPFAQEGACDFNSLAPFQSVSLDPSTPGRPPVTEIVPLLFALKESRPDVVIVLTPSAAIVSALQQLDLRPRFYYFGSLLGPEIETMIHQLESVAAMFTDLEAGWEDSVEWDAESGSSGDDGLENFIPFAVLLQDALAGGTPAGTVAP